MEQHLINHVNLNINTRLQSPSSDQLDEFGYPEQPYTDDGHPEHVEQRLK